MSNIGNKYIKIPTSLTIELYKSYLLLKAQKITIKIIIPDGLILNKENGLLVVAINPMMITSKKTKIIWGTFRNTLFNYIIGLSQGFKIILKLVGVGYRATIDNDNLQLKLGFSHLVNLKVPKSISVVAIKPNIIALKSYDKLSLSQYAALVRSYKLPEPYKGKGILYKGEKIIKKEGKKK